MRVLKIALAALSGLVGLFWLVGIFLPGDYRVERSIDIDAPQELVFAQVNDFRNTAAWSPWIAKDPTIQTEFSGPPQGVGHSSHWKSEHSGVGSQTITRSEPYEHIEIALTFGDMGEGTAEWSFTPSPSGVHTTWAMSGENQGAIGHYFALMMDGMLGADFEMGLQRLKEHAEKLAREEPKPAPVPTAAVENAGEAEPPTTAE